MTEALSIFKVQRYAVPKRQNQNFKWNKLQLHETEAQRQRNYMLGSRNLWEYQLPKSYEQWHVHSSQKLWHVKACSQFLMRKNSLAMFVHTPILLRCCPGGPGGIQTSSCPNRWVEKLQPTKATGMMSLTGVQDTEIMDRLELRPHFSLLQTRLPYEMQFKVENQRRK